jgi:hypothetical protein
MSFSFLIGELAKNPTADTTPALQGVAVRPKQNTHSMQESVSTFVSAVTALARLKAPLPEGRHDASEKTWHCARHILYALHSPGTTREAYTRETEDHWRRLYELHAVDVVMRIIHGRWWHDDETTARFCEWSNEQLLRLCRDTLINKPEPICFFESPYRNRYDELRSEHTQFSLSILGKYGDRSDLPILTGLIDDPIHGATAIKAARAIESR